ncbi:MAG TPA: lytic transglycosylase domain-containing protein [Sphingomonadaceae bacterium]|nr:lytic transglycosylase domain-containing protein [Sphingomonadaceae bacterium]
MLPASSRVVRASAFAAHRARRATLFSIPAVLAAALLLGIAPLASAQSPTGSPAAPVSAPPGAHPYAGYVAEASQRFGIPEAWIWSVMRVESAGNPAVTSHAGAMGLMQVMPGTYAELRSRHGLGPNPYDPRDSILAGAAYLREMHDRYGSSGFLAAYNAGPGRWEDYVSRGRPLPAETVAYMTRLGPMVGSSAAPAPKVVARVDRLAWTRASLFVRIGTGEASSRTDDEPDAPTLQGSNGESAPAQVRRPQPSSVATPAPTDAPHSLFAVRRPE